MAICGDNDGIVTIWSLANNGKPRLRWRLPQDSGGEIAVCLDKTETCFFTYARSGVARIWKIGDLGSPPKEVCKVFGRGVPAFSSDGRTLVFLKSVGIDQGTTSRIEASSLNYSQVSGTPSEIKLWLSVLSGTVGCNALGEPLVSLKPLEWQRAKAKLQALLVQSHDHN